MYLCDLPAAIRSRYSFYKRGNANENLSVPLHLFVLMSITRHLSLRSLCNQKDVTHFDMSVCVCVLQIDQRLSILSVAGAKDVCEKESWQKAMHACNLPLKHSLVSGFCVCCVCTFAFQSIILFLL